MEPPLPALCLFMLGLTYMRECTLNFLKTVVITG